MTTPVLDRGLPGPERSQHPDQAPGIVAQRLTLAVAALAAVASVSGLLASRLYPDDPGAREMFRGYDLVTLVVVLPTMVVAVARARDGSARALLVWLGTLAFTIYNYALYAFGAAFNDLFLVHVAIVPVAAVALGAELLRLDPQMMGRTPRRVARQAAGVLAFLAVGLGGMWIFYAARFAATGDTPAESELVVPMAITHLGYALDLTVLVPAYGCAAVLLWRHRPWGAVLGAVLFVAGLGQQLAYMTALVFQSRADITGSTPFDPGEPLVVAAYGLGAALLVRHAHPPLTGEVT